MPARHPPEFRRRALILLPLAGLGLGAAVATGLSACVVDLFLQEYAGFSISDALPDTY